MSNEIAKSTDTVSSSLVAGTSSGDNVFAAGYYTFQCFDKDGNLKWEDGMPNTIVYTGTQYLCGVALTSTTQITAWYVGLQNGTTPVAADTIASHGFTEFTNYSSSTRPAITFVAATLPSTGAGTSVATNSSAVSYTINGAGGTVNGAFLVSNSTKSGTTGTLFSAANFTGGSRTVVSGDTLNVTYTLNVTGS